MLTYIVLQQISQHLADDGGELEAVAGEATGQGDSLVLWMAVNNEVAILR